MNNKNKEKYFVLEIPKSNIKRLSDEASRIKVLHCRSKFKCLPIPATKKRPFHIVLPKTYENPEKCFRLLSYDTEIEFRTVVAKINKFKLGIIVHAIDNFKSIAEPTLLKKRPKPFNSNNNPAGDEDEDEIEEENSIESLEYTNENNGIVNAAATAEQKTRFEQSLLEKYKVMEKQYEEVVDYNIKLENEILNIRNRNLVLENEFEKNRILQEQFQGQAQSLEEQKQVLTEQTEIISKQTQSLTEQNRRLKMLEGSISNFLDLANESDSSFSSSEEKAANLRLPKKACRILRISRNATKEEVNQKYKALTVFCHTDKYEYNQVWKAKCKPLIRKLNNARDQLSC